MTIPFTYLIRDEFTGQQYYGSRTRKGCHPGELGVSYFSHSEPLKKLIAAVGVETFTFAVDQMFDTKAEALAYETYVLNSIGAARDPMWINRHNGGKNFCTTPESAAKSGEAQRGKKRSPESVAKQAAKIRGRRNTPEAIAKISASKYRKPRTDVGPSGAAGVCWEKQRERWDVRVRTDSGAKRHIGYFRDFAEAVAAAKTAFDERYKELSPYHNKTVALAVTEALAYQAARAKDR